MILIRAFFAPSSQGVVRLPLLPQRLSMKYLILPAAVTVLALSGAVHAHTPLFACYDNGDGTVLCEGGFSDGSSASGVAVRVIGADGAVLTDGQLDALSEFEFDKPDGDFTAVFDAGEGHLLEIPSSRILP